MYIYTEPATEKRHQSTSTALVLFPKGHLKRLSIWPPSYGTSEYDLESAAIETVSTLERPIKLANMTLLVPTFQRPDSSRAGNNTEGLLPSRIYVSKDNSRMV